MNRSALQVIRDEHAALAAMLKSLDLMVDIGPGSEPERFFEVVRAMLFYIDEFPERLHHPKESGHLFPRLSANSPELRQVIERLEGDHCAGERRVRELQHQLLAWELLGESRRQTFIDAAREYVRFYLEHMRLEETRILPRAEVVLTAADRAALDEVFARDPDPLAAGLRGNAYERLFSRIVMAAPEPIGIGPALRG